MSIRSEDFPIIQRYFAETPITKLHLSCGENILPGWLNADYLPVSDKIIHLDSGSPFPFPKPMFDYIFSEHMIEHMDIPKGFDMLCECYRVLKNNGKIRISTPDMQFLIDLYRPDKSELQLAYIKWATETFIKNAPYEDDIFVINNFVRAWGHQFIYDEKTLGSAMQHAGFSNIVRCNLNESNDQFLRNLENEKRMPPGFLKLESFTLEGTKA
jgi:predicted SAM-dependent methyltransferase